MNKTIERLFELGYAVPCTMDTPNEVIMQEMLDVYGFSREDVERMVQIEHIVEDESEVRTMTNTNSKLIDAYVAFTGQDESTLSASDIVAMRNGSQANVASIMDDANKTVERVARREKVDLDDVIARINDAVDGGYLGEVGEEIQSLGRIIAISVLRLFQSGHSKSMTDVDEHGDIITHDSYDQRIDDAYSNICKGRHDFDADEILGQSIFNITTLAIDGELHDTDTLPIITRLFRELSAFVRGSKAIIANTRISYVDDVNAIYEERVRLNRAQVGYIQNDNATSEVVENIERKIASLRLTNRQAQVLNMRLCGLSLEDIAERLDITENTVLDHLNAIRAKARKSDKIDTDKERINRVVNNQTKAVHVVAFLGRDIVGEWDTIGKASKALNVSKGKISDVLHGRRESCKGYTFKWGTIRRINTASELMKTDYDRR